VFARITTFYTADPSPYGEPELIHRLRIRGQEVLRQMDGFEGLYVFMDRQSGKLISITLWESEEAMQRSEESVRPLRKEIGGGLATNLVDVGHYEVGEILEQERRERQIVEQELRVARSIQHASLPKEVPELEGWQISPYYQPAREVGGDFYDFFELDDERVGVVVGDATGKGMPAALMAEASSNMLRAVAQALSSYSPGEVLSRVNETLVARIPDNMFVTCFYAILDPKNGSLSYANAGHDLPYVLRGSGGECEELRARGMPLGLMPQMSYEEKEIVLQEGDSALFYTDGFVEAHDPQREMFGFPRLRALVAQHGEERALGNLLLEELYSFVGEGWEQEDDITLLTLNRSVSLS
jgi:serine phosphatase RsbU (regulator of sigma subunit)/heme-degrading monooxygenase HmoA